MFEYWFCIGIILVMGLIVVGFATLLGKLTVKLFSRETGRSQTSVEKTGCENSNRESTCRHVRA